MMTPHPGAAWRANADALAAFTFAHFPNRSDLWGAYGSHGAWTAPAKDRRGHEMLTEERLARHFRGWSRLDVIGLHTSSPEQTSRFAGVDFDAHTDDELRQRLLARQNLQAAARTKETLESRGCHVLVEDSNGSGGLHLWIRFDAPVATWDLYAFLQDTLRIAGAPAGTETFPKQGRHGFAGNWLRLPGRHHTRAHWSRFARNGRWLDGNEAVDAWLAFPATPAHAIPRASEPTAPAQEAIHRVPPPPMFDAGPAVERRVRAYLERLPRGLTAGDGRNNVGYRFAAFLRRDCGLAEAAALEWLRVWNASNRPPLGETELQAIAANAERYGTGTARMYEPAARVLRRYAAPRASHRWDEEGAWHR